jgi:phosphoglycolate phosphatase
VKIDTVLFDLDGTLLDTAPDLVFALNQVLLEYQRPVVPLALIRPVISLGAHAMIEVGFGIQADDPLMETYFQRLLAVYSEHLADQTQLFPEMSQVLDSLEQQQIAWGIVTNKSAWLTEPLLQQVGLATRPFCIISGDTLSQKKPYPDQLLYAAELAKTSPQSCVYVGDAARDIEAGQRAGMATLVALYGYINTTDDPQQWGATGMIEHPFALLSWLQQSSCL